MAQFLLNPLTLSNINRFSKFFHCQNQEKICNRPNIITIDPTKPQVCRYTTLWNVSVLKATIIENKTTSVTTHFKKQQQTTCLLSQLLSKVTVTSCSFYPRDAMLARVIEIVTCLSVRLSVRPSVTRRYCVKTKKASGMISSPSGSPKTLVFWRQILSPNSRSFPPNGGLK